MLLITMNPADIFVGLKAFNDAAVFVTSPKQEKNGKKM